MNKSLIYLLIQLKISAIYKKQINYIAFNYFYIPILNLLYTEGYIQSFCIITDTITSSKKIKIYMRNWNNFSLLNNLKIMSMPSCIRTIRYRQLIYNIYNIKKIYVISTSKGLKTQLQCKREHIGGTMFFIC